MPLNSPCPSSQRVLRAGPGTRPRGAPSGVSQGGPHFGGGGGTLVPAAYGWWGRRPNRVGAAWPSPAAWQAVGHRGGEGVEDGVL